MNKSVLQTGAAEFEGVGIYHQGLTHDTVKLHCG